MAYRCVITSSKSGKKETIQWLKDNKRINIDEVPQNVLKNEECRKQRFIQAGKGAKAPPKSKTPKAEGDLLKIYSCDIEKGKKVYRRLGKFVGEYDIPSSERKAIPCRTVPEPNIRKSPVKKTVAKKSTKRSPLKSPPKTKKKSAVKVVGKKSQARKRQIHREEAFAKLSEQKPKSKSNNLKRSSPRSKPKSKSKSKSQEKGKAPAVITTAMLFKRKKGAAKKAPSDYVD